MEVAGTMVRKLAAWEIPQFLPGMLDTPASFLTPLAAMEFSMSAGRPHGTFMVLGSGRAALYLNPGGLLIPLAGTPEDMARLASEAVIDLCPVSLLRGSPELVEAVVDAIGPALGRPRLDRIHLVMEHGPEARGPSPLGEDLVKVREDMLDTYLGTCLAMRLEELGHAGIPRDPTAYRRTVEARIRQGRAWVILARDGGIVFKVDLGQLCSFGARLEGIYTRPDVRGQGLGARGTAAMARRLLDRGFPSVSLHVWEHNLPAIRAYTNAGFVQTDRVRSLLY